MKRKGKKTPAYIRPSQLAAKAGVTRAWVYREIQNGKLDADDVGGYLLVRYATATKWLKNRKKRED